MYRQALRGPAAQRDPAHSARREPIDEQTKFCANFALRAIPDSRRDAALGRTPYQVVSQAQELSPGVTDRQ